MRRRRAVGARSSRSRRSAVCAAQATWSRTILPDRCWQSYGNLRQRLGRAATFRASATDFRPQGQDTPSAYLASLALAAATAGGGAADGNQPKGNGKNVSEHEHIPSTQRRGAARTTSCTPLLDNRLYFRPSPRVTSSINRPPSANFDPEPGEERSYKASGS